MSNGIDANKIVVTYSEINQRYIEELGKGNRLSMDAIRKTLHDEKSAVAKANYENQAALLSQMEEKSRGGDYEDAGLGESLFDFVGSGLTMFADTALFGAPTFLMQKAAPDFYDNMMNELNDTKAGRIGGMLGQATGFLNAIGAVKKLGAKAVLGTPMFKSTTRGLQRKAGEKLAREVNEMTLKNLNKTGITKSEALNMVRQSTDDVIGFPSKVGGGMKSRIKGFTDYMTPWKHTTYPGMRMEQGSQFVRTAQETLSKTVPGRLDSYLKSKNIVLRSDQLQQLSQTVVNQVSKTPINNIDQMVQSLLGSRLGSAVSQISGGIAQEAFDLWMVGSLLDISPILKGELKPEHGQGWGSFVAERMFHHGLTGAAFGGIRTGLGIPAFMGGSSMPAWRKIVSALDVPKTNQALMKFGGNVRGMNKYIKDQVNTPDHMREVLKMTMKTNPNFTLRLPDGRMIRDGSSLLRKGFGIKPGDLPLIKNELIAYNNNYLKILRKGLPLDISKDLILSSPRWVAGAYVMNKAGLNEGMFDSMDPDEAAAHFILSAWMSKRGRPLRSKGETAEPSFGWHTGERPYFYNSEINKMYKTLESEGMYMGYADELVKSANQSVWESVSEKSLNRDVEEVIRILEQNKVIYNEKEFKEKNGRPLASDNSGDMINPELSKYLASISAYIKTRGYDIHPNTKSSEMTKALDLIKKTQSTILSTSENQVTLSSPDRMLKSVIKGEREIWDEFSLNLFNHYREQVNLITGSRDFVGNDGFVKNRINWKRLENISERDSRALSELLAIQQNLEEYNLIKVNEVKIGQKFGLEVDKNIPGVLDRLGKNHQEFIENLGKKVYGQGSNEVVDPTDPMLWLSIGKNIFSKNIDVNWDILNGRKGALPSDIASTKVDDISSIIHEILAPTGSRSDRSAIVDNIMNLKPKMEGEAGELYNKMIKDSPGEVRELQDMLYNLYSIMKTSKSPVGGTARYNIGQLRELKDKLIELGMPDPSGKGAENFRLWTQRMVQHGINEAISGLDVSYEAQAAINTLMEGGLIVNSKGGTATGSRLEMPNKITIEQIQNLNSGYSDAKAKELVDMYAEIVQNIPNKAINKNETFVYDKMSEQQLATIRAARTILNMNDQFIKSKELIKPIEDLTAELQESGQILEAQLRNLDPNNTGDLTAIENIKMKMNLVEQQDYMLKEWQTKFWTNVQGDVVRSAAFYHHVLNTTKGEKTMAELFSELNTAREKLDTKSWDTITENINSLQQEIAKKWLNRPEVFTSIESQREEEILKYRAEEMEGRLREDGKNKMSPDNFFATYRIKDDIPMMEKVSNEVVRAGGTIKRYENSTEALLDLYNHTSNKNNNVEGFKDAMYRLTGVKKGPQGYIANTTLKNDVVRLHNLFEKSFSVNKVQLNLGPENKSTSFTAVYNKGQITHSSFTDLYNDIFKGDQLYLLSDQMLYNNKLVRTASDNTLDRLFNVVNNENFFMTEQSGSTKNQKFFRDGASSEAAADMFITVDLKKSGVKGKQFIVGIDENISFLIGENQFNNLAQSYKKWYKDAVSSSYVRNARSKYSGADQLFRRLERHYENLINSTADNGLISANLFKQQSNISNNKYMNNAVMDMFNVMYSSKVDGNWLSSGYSSPKASLKDFKYKRLASNQGYARNSEKRRNLVLEVWKDDAGFKGKAVRKYAPMKYSEVVVIDDVSDVSKPGEAATKLLTDNRSVAEYRYEQMAKDGLISDKQKNEMLKDLKEFHSINAESANGATVVRKSYMDYILIDSGNSNLIGNSAGHKPVGVSSFKDVNGNIHVIYNKTHYFTDKSFNTFFDNHPNVDQILLRSGAKKADIINENDTGLNNNLKYLKAPSVESGETLASYLNGIPKGTLKYNSNNPGSNGVTLLEISQTLNGAVYGTPHEAKILKQLSNWSDHQAELYKWSKADAAKQFQMVWNDLYDPSLVGNASSFAREYLGQTGIKGNRHNPENENISSASLWIEGGGVPFSRISKNLYDNIVKSKFIDDAGVFDGFTNAGGAPILKPNFSLDLNVPVYQKVNGVKTQTILGEAAIGFSYLNRTIPYTRAFKTSKSKAEQRAANDPQLKRRENWDDASTVNVSFNIKTSKGIRDIIVDIKNATFYDPLSELKVLPKAEQNVVTTIAESIKNGKMTMFREVNSELSRLANLNGITRGVNLVGLFSPAPRTGPHDLVIAKIKRFIDVNEGGVAELNAYDLTLRAQRDHDTDKLPFYLDTPHNIVTESYKNNSIIAEALPLPSVLKKAPAFDPYNASDFWAHKDGIKKADFLRGPVVKTQRKLDYARLLFRDIKSIKIAKGLEIVFDANPENIQRMVTDVQSILDPYSGTPRHIFDPKFIDNTLFGRSDKYKGETISVQDSPFFKLKITKNNKISEDVINSELHKSIVRKILNDYGRLLTAESGIWEAGESKTPRYQDMLQLMRDFKSEYHPKRINWNFYNYLKYSKKVSEQEVNNIFFKDGNPKNEMRDIFSELSSSIDKLPTVFLKSMDAISQQDYMKTLEIYRPSGDYFNSGVQNWLGRYRGEILESIKAGKGIPETFEKTDIIDELWRSFSAKDKSEQMIVQLNNIENEISRIESYLKNRFRENIEDTPSTLKLKEDLLIKRNALMAMSDKLMLEKSDELLNIKKIYGGTDVFVSGAGVVRDAKNGKVIETLHKGIKDHPVKKGHVFLKGGVQLKPVVQSEMFDAVALTRSLLGYYAHIHQGDLVKFKDIVRTSQNDIIKSMSETMEFTGIKDWSRHYSKVQEIIDKGLVKIEELANLDADFSSQISSVTSVGNYPKGKESYGLDYLMALMVPRNQSPYDRTQHYNPITKEFLPAMRNIDKSVIDAVFGALKNYNLHPDYNGFVKDLAKVHRDNFNTLVNSEGFVESARRINESTFEGALFGNAIENVLHDPLMSRKEYKTIQENFELMSGVKSDFAEMYRQLLQGATTDPGTLFRLKSRLIETHGQKAYDGLILQARGEIIYDGISSRQFSNDSGVGQLIGDIINPSSYKIYNAPKVNLRGRRNTEIRRLLDETIGKVNDRNNQKKKENCD